MHDALTEGHVEKEFDEADQIATLPTSMAVEQVPAGIDIEGRACIPVQRAKPYKLLPGAATTGSPVMSKQIIQQREMLFELFQVRIQRLRFLQESRLRRIGPFSQARMVGEKNFLRGAEARAVAGTKP
jgi:hypothetical protein